MKTINRKPVGTHVFNLRLYLEGLKRLRVVGLACAILAVTVSALVPIVSWIERIDRDTTEILVEDRQLCVPAAVMVFLAPIFFYVLFSFLHKRKQSDFFHAIPYTRTCVFISFTAAALSFVWAIQLLSSAVALFLWSMTPSVYFSPGGYLAHLLICMSAAAMLSAFMMLALSVAGTGGTTTILFFLFAGFTRVVAAYLLWAMESIDGYLWVEQLWQESFFAVLWLQPLCLPVYWIDSTVSTVLYSPANVLYSLAVTVALYALAGVIFKHRRSEMAGSPAPGPRTQTLFRCMLTTVPALLIPTLALGGDLAFSGLLILIVVVLLVYFLYELITTKRARSMLRAIPSLGFVIGFCVLFAVGVMGWRSAVLAENIPADSIAEVSIPDMGIAGYSYHGRTTDDIFSDDETLLALVAEELADSAEAEARYLKGGSYPSSFNGRRTRVVLRLENGRTLYRSVRIDDKRYDSMVELYTQSYVNDDRFLELPPIDTVFDIYGDLAKDGFVLSSRDTWSLLYDVFSAEYATLTREQKQAVMAPVLNPQGYENSDVHIYVSGSVGGRHYQSNYAPGRHMPRTTAYMAVLVTGDNQSTVYVNKVGRDGTAWGLYGDVMALLARVSPTAPAELSVRVTRAPWVDSTRDSNLQYVTAEETMEFLAFLHERNALAGEKPTGLPGDPAETLETLGNLNDLTVVRLDALVEGDNGDRIEISFAVLCHLTREEAKTLGMGACP